MASAAAFREESVLGRLVNAVGCSSGGRILDLACGPGIVAEALAPLASQIIGVDATPEMVRLAKARFARAGLGNGRFHLALAESLPFGAGKFHDVVTRLSFHHFPDVAAVLSEVKRVLCPRGRLIVADIMSSGDPGEAALHNAIEQLRDPTHVRMLKRPEFREMLRSAGFEPITEEAWEQERSFSEWAQIVADPARTGPLREIMRALARAKVRAGINLREEAGEVHFTHAWLLIVARSLPGG